MSAFVTVILLPYKTIIKNFFVPTLCNYLELVIFVFQRIVDRLLALVEKKGEAP